MRDWCYIKRSRGCCCLNQSWCRLVLLSWLMAEMLDRKHKMEEAADTSSAGPLGASLFPDNQNWDDRALKDPEEPVSSDAYRCVCVCVCCDLGNRPMGGLVGGRVGRISNSVQHSYWSLDTNNGRAKEDLVCVRTPSSSPAVLQCHWEVYGIEGEVALPFWAALYIWKTGLPACLGRPLPPPPYKAGWDLNYIWKRQTQPH